MLPRCGCVAYLSCSRQRRRPGSGHLHSKLCSCRRPSDGGCGMIGANDAQLRTECSLQRRCQMSPDSCSGATVIGRDAASGAATAYFMLDVSACFPSTGWAPTAAHVYARCCRECAMGPRRSMGRGLCGSRWALGGWLEGGGGAAAAAGCSAARDAACRDLSALGARLCRAG